MVPLRDDFPEESMLLSLEALVYRMHILESICMECTNKSFFIFIGTQAAIRALESYHMGTYGTVDGTQRLASGNNYCWGPWSFQLCG